MKPNKRLIAIAGAGIAGMTAALALAQAGFRIILYEKSSQAASTGTGIQISPNAYKVLDKIGLSTSIKRAAFVPDRIEIGSGYSGKILTEFELGQSIYNRHGAPYVVLHRIDLAQILESACQNREDIQILRGHTACDLAVHKNGMTVMSETPGSIREDVVSALVAADGTWSTLRKFVKGVVQPQFTGKIAWRALCNRAAFPEELAGQSTGLWLGHNAHLVHYPIRQERFYNIIAITKWNETKPPMPGWLKNSQQSYRADAFSSWSPQLKTLVEQELDWGGWPIFSTDGIGAMARGSLAIIGDAAHTMPPFAAQGGAQGIEDAWVLAQECQKHPQDLEKAFQNFEQARAPRLRKVLHLSNSNGKIYQLPPPLSTARNMVMQVIKQEKLQQRMDWLYGWDV